MYRNDLRLELSEQHLQLFRDYQQALLAYKTSPRKFAGDPGDTTKVDAAEQKLIKALGCLALDTMDKNKSSYV